MANSFDGATISDMLQLAEFTSWLRRSSRDQACVLVSQKQNGKPVVPVNQICKTVGTRAVVVLLSNTVQQSARNQLSTLNAYHGAARIFPAGDEWTHDPRLVRFVRGDLPATEFLESIDEQLNIIAEKAAQSSPKAPQSVPAGSWKASSRQSPASNGAAAEPARPGLADVRGAYKLYRIDAEHAELCRDFILSASREIPCILVSKAEGAAEPYLDINVLLDEIEDNAAVLEIMDQETSDLLNAQLPSWARAYNGACRFLPPHASNAGARLRRLESTESSPQAVSMLSELALNAAYRDGYTLGGDTDSRANEQASAADDTGKHTHSAAEATAGATVERLFDNVAYVRTGDGSILRTDLSAPVKETGIAADRLVCRGQVVQGHIIGSDDFGLVPLWIPSARALAEYVEGSTIVGLVAAVYADLLVVTLYPALGDEPAVEVRVHGPELLAGSDIDPHTDLRRSVAKGQPIALHVERHTGDEWLFSLPDTAAPMVRPTSLLEGGPEWLNPENASEYLTRLRENRSLSTVPLDDLLDSIDSMDAARSTIRALHAQLCEAEQLNHELDSANENLRTSNSNLRRNNRNYAKAQDVASPLAPFTGLFPSIREEFDWQLRAQSLLQFNVTERVAHPLDGWSYASGFFDSLAECEHGDMSRMSLLRTMLFVLMGRDDLNGARAHRLREGNGGDDAGRVDEHGNYIYRVNVHGQYRLHYTHDTAHHVTFRSVGPHDAELR